MSVPSHRVASRTFPLILAAPSGAGKTTIARRLRERRSDIVFSVSATTRQPRRFERDGRDYQFVSADEFRGMIDAGELVEWAEVHGNFYGTPAKNVRRAVERGEYLLLDIDVQGAQQIRTAVPEAVHVFVLPPTGGTLAERLLRRGSEDDSVRQRRLANACHEVLAAATFDYVIVNDDLEASVDAVEQILGAEARRVHRAVHLDGELQRVCSQIREHLTTPGADHHVHLQQEQP